MHGAAVSDPEHGTFPGMSPVLGPKGGHGNAQIFSRVCGYGLLYAVCSHLSSEVGWRVVSLLGAVSGLARLALLSLFASVFGVQERLRGFPVFVSCGLSLFFIFVLIISVSGFLKVLSNPV